MTRAWNKRLRLLIPGGDMLFIIRQQGRRWAVAVADHFSAYLRNPGISLGID